ncbi:MAG: hypothetical protein L0229_02260 [Blastocatellia bacterium]|nr:hypothetical protein [Blastocatellia bacterium]
MEERFESTLTTDAMELEGWKGYEFWSAQLEVREEPAEYHSEADPIFQADGLRAGVDAGRDSAYPF